MREVQSPWASCFSDSDLGSYQLATVMLLRLVATAAATAQNAAAYDPRGEGTAAAVATSRERGRVWLRRGRRAAPHRATRPRGDALVAKA